MKTGRTRVRRWLGMRVTGEIIGSVRSSPYVRVVACDVAQRVRGIVEKDVIVIGGGRGEQCRGSVSALMQCNVKVTGVSEDVDRDAVGSALPRFLDNVVP